jgi:hypothetical protein
MSNSERMERMTYNYSRYNYSREYADKEDVIFEDRIVALLNHPKIDRDCLVDAYYYDYSVIPHIVCEEYNFYRDMYLIYGITNDGQIVSKWVERYDLDSDKPIHNGKLDQ